MRYAEKTSVPIDRSRTEIERTLMRYGSDQFVYGLDAGRAMIAFRAHGRQVRFVLPMPSKTDPAFNRTPTGRTRRGHVAEIAWEQGQRQRWRALALVIKAKLEAVGAGITSFEEEFLAHTLLPNQETVGQYLLPRLDKVYREGRVGRLLPASFDNPDPPTREV